MWSHSRHLLQNLRLLLRLCFHTGFFLLRSQAWNSQLCSWSCSVLKPPIDYRLWDAWLIELQVRLKTDMVFEFFVAWEKDSIVGWSLHMSTAGSPCSNGAVVEWMLLWYLGGIQLYWKYILDTCIVKYYLEATTKFVSLWIFLITFNESVCFACHVCQIWLTKRIFLKFPTCNDITSLDFVSSD